MNFAALVLAGSRPGADPLAGTEGKPHKALIEIEGRSLLERVVIALREAGAGRVAVSCDHPAVVELATRLGAEVLPTGAGPSESVLLALDSIGTPLVVTTADHALLSPDWLRQILRETPADADLSLMLAKREKIEAALPGTRRTYLRFADGAWSGCNLFFLQTVDARLAVAAWKAVEADRKRPWRIVRKLGLRTFASYAFGRLTLAQGIATLGRRLGVEASLVEAADGRAAIDVDKPADLKDIRALLATRPTHD